MTKDAAQRGRWTFYEAVRIDVVIQKLLHEFNSTGRKKDHPQKQPTVLPALDVGLAVLAFPVTDGHFNELEIQLGGAKKEVKITEGIEVPKIRPVF